MRSRLGGLRGLRSRSKNAREGAHKRVCIDGREDAEAFYNNALLEGGEDRLDDGGVNEAGGLLIGDDDLAPADADFDGRGLEL